MYSGLFIPLRDADGLAGVLGHEIGHVLAGHDAEQMSRNLFDVAVRFLFIHTIGRFGIYAAEVLRRGIDIDLPNSREKEVRSIDSSEVEPMSTNLCAPGRGRQHRIEYGNPAVHISASH